MQLSGADHVRRRFSMEKRCNRNVKIQVKKVAFRGSRAVIDPRKRSLQEKKERKIEDIEVQNTAARPFFE